MAYQSHLSTFDVTTVTNNTFFAKRGSDRAATGAEVNNADTPTGGAFFYKYYYTKYGLINAGNSSWSV